MPNNDSQLISANSGTAHRGERYYSILGVAHHLPLPKATSATQNIFTDNLHAPLCTVHNIETTSRRGSADGFGCANDAEEVDSPRPRLTREQVVVLEKQFMENNKPTTAMRFSIAQRAGLSMQRVGVSFFFIDFT